MEPEPPNEPPFARARSAREEHAPGSRPCGREKRAPDDAESDAMHEVLAQREHGAFGHSPAFGMHGLIAAVAARQHGLPHASSWDFWRLSSAAIARRSPVDHPTRFYAGSTAYALPTLRIRRRSSSRRPAR